ncbi:glycoside hydrolase family 128 [Lecanosticta acicola]|uniref:Glycoside hydrolase family 128 n=1 Tax=Lecanosticta acicola TaxID=111012 RepID=A0AAI9E8P4_9PEZI|nr:glycoside hydrolase family 128 [Lecanosticta acicola]
MRRPSPPFSTALLTLLLPLVLAQDGGAATLTSPKRGLIYVQTENVKDDHFWTSNTTDLTWYYNYQATPTSDMDHSRLQFVPMLWGSADSDTFYSTVKGLHDGGMNISAVLAFNEPDGCTDGGSCVDAQTAAQLWKSQIEPLQKLGIALGAPAVTGSPNGFVWLQSFFTACAGGCSVDFIPTHFYGSFEGLASHVGQVNATYSNISSIWVTEYGYPGQSLQNVQSYYNQTSAFLNRVSWIDRYSYFGSFRSDVSNVGPNAAMLTQKGELTDIGAWYLGESATGNVPKGDASTIAKGAVWAIALVALSAFWLA